MVRQQLRFMAEGATSRTLRNCFGGPKWVQIHRVLRRFKALGEADVHPSIHLEMKLPAEPTKLQLATDKCCSRRKRRHHTSNEMATHSNVSTIGTRTVNRSQADSENTAPRALTMCKRAPERLHPQTQTGRRRQRKRQSQEAFTSCVCSADTLTQVSPSCNKLCSLGESTHPFGTCPSAFRRNSKGNKPTKPDQRVRQTPSRLPCVWVPTPTYRRLSRVLQTLW